MIRRALAALLVCPSLLSASGSVNDAAAARAEIAPLFAQMEAAANAHDTDRHLAFYAHDASLTFVVNDQKIVGFDALREKQRQWWNDGKSDVIYTPVGEPEYRELCPGDVVLTYFLRSRRTMPSGETRTTGFGVTSIWQKRPEGWRIIYAHESTVSR